MTHDSMGERDDPLEESPGPDRGGPEEGAARSGLMGRLLAAFAPEPESGSEPRAQSTGLQALRRMRVEDVAIPKAEIEAVPADITLPELVDRFRKTANTRLPVFEGTLDTPIGMVHLKDIALAYGFEGGEGEEPFDLRCNVRPLLYAPPSMPIGVLLAKMQADRTHMALVIDEYGGVDGLVTLEDLIEQVIGEIEDEHDIAEGRFWIEEKPGVYLAQSRAPLGGVRGRHRPEPDARGRRGGARHAGRARVRPDGPRAGARRGDPAPLGRRDRGGGRRPAPHQAPAPAPAAARRARRGPGGRVSGRTEARPAGPRGDVERPRAQGHRERRRPVPAAPRPPSRGLLA